MHGNFTHDASKRERASVYAFFSHMILNALSKDDLLHLKKNIPMLGPFADEGGADLSLVHDFLLENKIDSTLLYDLAADHACLFLGLKRNSPHPYGSVYLNKSGIVMDEESEEVAAFYAANGVSITDDVCEPPDHLGVELGFMVHTLKALQEPDSKASSSRLWQTEVVQYRFLNKHINSWSMDLMKDIRRTETKYPFYPSLLKQLGEFLQHEELCLIDFLKCCDALPDEASS